MLRQKAERDQRQRNEASRGPSEVVARLRDSAPLVAVVVVGFLLGWRRYGDILSRATGNLLDAVTSNAADGDHRERAATNTADDETAESQSAGNAATGIDAAVTDFSSPSTRGMPLLGVGTDRNADYDECFESVRQALRYGYRHIDATEQRESYYNEDAVGDAIAAADVDREDLFVATKVSPDDLDYDHVLTSVEESLDRLGLEYLDLLYVHRPTGDYEATDTLDAFAELRREGVIEEIGVSNFEPDQLAEAIEVCEEPVFANQVEMHPLLPQNDLREFCDREDVALVAHSPIARGNVEDVDELQEVAAKHGATPEQVSLAWLREKGVAAVPAATTDEHLRENWLSLAVELDDEDVEQLDAIEERRRIVDPDEAPWNR